MKKIHSTLAEHVSWYGKWHNNKHHSVAHYAILIAFIGTLSFGIASTIQVPQSEAQEVKQLKEELTAKNQEFSAAVMLYAQAQGTEQRARANTLKEIAQRRSDSMTLAAANDPQAFIEHVLPEAVKAHMPADVLALVEAKTKMEGTLVIIHTDTPGEGTYQTTLETKGGKAYTVHTAGGSLKKISDGSTVSIEGYVLGYQLVTADASAATVLAAAPVNSSVGEQKTLVMLVNFSDNPTQPWTPAQVNTMYFGTPTENPQSLNSYYRENSYNQTWYTGAVAGWFTIEKSQLSSICSMTDLQTVIDPLAAAAGFDISAYGHKVYMYPTTYCTGLSTVGAFPSRSLVPKAGSTDVGTYQMMYHELGHALGKGRQHARMELCGTKQIDVAANCTFTEYGDPYDVMGASQSTDTTLSLITNTRLFNALGRILLSWIPPVRVQTITTDGVYTLSSLETAQSSGTQVFKIYKADSSGGSDFITYSAEPLKSYYYLSYRQPYGTFDGNLPNYVTGGTSVHADSAVLDGTAGDGNNFNTAILDNMSFIDDVNKITVTQLSHTSSAATVQVAFTPGFCPWPPLFLNTVGVLNNQPVQPGGQVAFTYGVTGSEDPRCGTNTFALTGVVPVGWTSTSTTVSVTPTASKATGTISITPPANQPVGYVNIYLKATDTTNPNRINTSAPIPVFVSAPQADTTSPIATLTSPTNGSTVSGAVTVSATATDNVGVTSVAFYKDSDTTPFTTLGTTPYSTSFNTLTLANGAHTFVVKAYDAAGNVGVSSAVTVTVNNGGGSTDAIPPSVSITSPANNSIVAKNTTVVITANANDNVGVTKIEFYVNGTRTCTGTNTTCSWKVPKTPSKKYTLTAKAYDAAGNVSTSSAVSVTSSK